MYQLRLTSQFGEKEASHERIHTVRLFHIKFKASYTKPYVWIAHIGHKITEQQVSHYLKSHMMFTTRSKGGGQSDSYKGIKGILVHNLVVSLRTLALSFFFKTYAWFIYFCTFTIIS